jgi:drug/metabolite transporter (DMT)-like permease
MSRLAAPVSASGAAVLAALLWSFYYFFVLRVSPGVAPSALLAWPFVVGAVGYLAWTARAGELRQLGGAFRAPVGWLRVGLLVGMQLAVLAATYLTGAVDTSILSLLGDVALTPVLVIGLLGEGRSRARSPLFLGGIALASAGALLTIVGGGSPEPVRGFGWLAVPLVPVTVALYFLLVAQANRRAPMSVVVGQSTLGAALVSIALAGVVPGGYAGLVVLDAPAILDIVALGVTSFFIAPVLYFWAIERAGLVLPAVLMAAIPVFTVLLSVPLLGFLPPLVALLGVPIAVLGALLALTGEHVPWSRVDGVAATVPGPTPGDPAEASRTP